MSAGPSLALAVRSLRLDARTPLLHLLRGGLAVLLLLALVYAYGMSAQVGAAGLNLYQALIRINFFFVGVLAVAIFATSITEERREGSLGLMRMAGLNPIGILIGKSLSQLTVALSLLAVQLPFTMFAVTLGGVRSHQIFGGFILLGAYLLFAYGVGLLCSTLFQTGVKASRYTLGVLVLAAVWPMIWELLTALCRAVGIPAASGAIPSTATILGGLEATLATGYDAPLFGPTVTLHLVAFAVCFLLSWLLFDFVETRVGKQSTRRQWFGVDHWGGSSRVPRFSGNALVWKDYRLFVGGRQGLIIRFLVYGAGTVVLAWLYNPFGASFMRHSFGRAVLAMVAVGVLLDLGSLAGRVFRDEIGWQTYSTLLLLPKSVLQISYGKVMGCMTAVFPALVFLALGVVCSDGEMLLLLGPVVFCFVAILYMLLPLIAYVSLMLPRGAFPITLFGVSVLGIGIYLGTAGNPGAMCCGALFLFVIAWRLGAKLHEKILTKLGELAGIDL